MSEAYCRNFKFRSHLLKSIKKAFFEVPIVGFQNGKSLKYYLVRAAFPKMDNAWGSELCGKGIDCAII